MANYPAPVLAADRPVGVTAPGDPFVLPSNVTGGSTVGSVVAEWHREVSAGEKFGLTALGLTGANFAMYSGNKFYNATLAGDDEFAEVLFPNYGQTWDFALGWAALQGGIALPIALNRATVKWCQTSWTPGLTINFYGENLAHGNVEGGAAYVAVQPVGGGEAIVYPTTAANCHRVPFTVPNLAVGSYNVWEHNGHGGDCGWSKRMTVQVVANANHVKTHNFGTATRITLSPTDAAANDAKMAALWIDGSNLEIDPVPGPYPVTKTVVIPSLSRLASSDPNQKLQFTPLTGATWPANENRGLFGTNSATMVLLENVELLNLSNVNLNNNAAQGREVGLLTCANVTQFWRKGCKARWAAPYSEFQAGVVRAAEPVSCFRFKTSQHLFFDDCEDTGSGNPFIECAQIFMTNHSMIGTNNADHQLYGLHTKEWSVIGGSVRDLNPNSQDGVDRLIRVIKCGGQNGTNGRHYFEGITGADLGVVWEGNNPSPDANQFELNLYEGNTVKLISAVTAGTATTVTTSANLANSAVADYHLVTIVAGRGRGQTRGIVSSTGFSITVDEAWNVIPDTTSVIQTSVFARDVTFYKVNYAGKQPNATDSRFTHNSFFNGFGGVHGFILNQCTGSYMRQGWSVISTQHDEAFIDQSAFNVVKNSAFPHCRWGSRIESNPPVQTWKAPAPGVLALLDQNNTYDDPILSEVVFQLPRDAANINATPVVGFMRNKTKVARTALNDYTPTFVDDPAFPPVAPLPQALRNFTQAVTQALVSQVTIPAGQYPFSYLGLQVLTLAQQPWYTTANVNKINAVSANRLGYTSGSPANPNFGVRTLNPAPNASDALPGYILDLKLPITVDGTLFGGLPTGTTTPVPTITSFAPTSGTPSSNMVITGTNFSGATQVSVNSATVASFVVNSATQITATLSSTQATGKVRVTTAGGTAVSTADFVVTAPGTKSGYKLISLGDSRVNYEGDTGTQATTSVPALTGARLAQAGFNGGVLNRGYPGRTSEWALSDTSAEGFKAAGQTAVQEVISQFDPTKYNIVQVGFGANGGSTVDAMRQVHEALKAGGADFTIATLILNRLDPPEWVGGIVDRDNKNTQILASLGVWSNAVSRTDQLPQLYASDAPTDPFYFWENDKTGRSRVHLTTEGNRQQAERDARAFAQLMNLTLPALPIPSFLSPTALEQNSQYMAYESGPSWAINSYNDQYSLQTGAASAAADAKVGVTAQMWGFRLRTPLSNAGGPVQVEVRDQAGNLIETLTGTQYANVPPAQAYPLSTVVQKLYTSAAIRAPKLSRTNSAGNTALLNDVWEFCDQAGNWPLSPELIPWRENISSGKTTITANRATKTAGTDGGWDAAVLGVAFVITSGVGEKLRVSIPASSNPSQIGGSLVCGVTSSLPTDPNYTAIGNALFLSQTQSGTFASGQPRANYGGTTPGSIAFVVTDAGIYAYVGTSLLHDFQVVPTPGATYYFTCSLFNYATTLFNWTYTAAQIVP